MHNMLTEKHPELHTIIKYEYFVNYYKENYGYRFGHPQVYVCSTCDDLNMKIKSTTLNDNAKHTAAAELIDHKMRIQVTEMCRYKYDVAGIVFDFMQNLPLPAIPVQEMFYLCKLWHYVFCVHNIGDQKAMFYTYHEGGPDDVCTMLNHYMETHMSPGVKELHLFCDSC
ncbi:hypothetical protein PR048_000981 [Dryococelus australis]|uniref:Transposase n=1 Tax=Dryococelus australis TaxID=614101 RepID=A0ABQ9IHK1_9NEOP|nr:hypothetical protein PR048_000981 [Dryococelus australis]